MLRMIDPTPAAPVVRDFYTVCKDFGLPLAVLTWGVLSYLQQNKRRLSIRQVGSSVTDTITRRPGGGTYVQFEVVITNDSPKETIVIAYYDIELPWNETLEPAPDPMDAYPESNVYNHPDAPLKQLERDYVINHRRFQNGKLAAGESYRGFFLAYGVEPLPVDLAAVEKRLRCIKAPFVIEDTKGKSYRSKVPIQLYY